MVEKALLSELLDCIDYIVLLLDEDLSIAKSNRYAELILGCSESELSAMRLPELLDPNERRKVVRVIEKATSRRGGFAVFRSLSLGRCGIEYSICPLEVAGKEARRYLLVGKPGEADGREHAERQTKTLWARILEGIDEPLFVVDTATRAIRSANGCAVAFSGYSKAEIQGKTMFDFLSFGQGEGGKSSMKSSINEAYAKKGCFKGRVHFIRKGGTSVPCDCYSFPLFTDRGKADDFVTMIIDRSDIEGRMDRVREFAMRATGFASELSDLAGGTPGRFEGRRLSDLGFTERQIEIAALVSKGHPSKEIARKLGISESTVKNHLSGMYRKIGASSRVDFLHRLVDERIWIA